MTVGVEGDVDAGVPHLVPNICCVFTIRDQLACEEVAEIVKSRSHHSGAFHNRPPNIRFEVFRLDETVAVAGEDECGLSIAYLEVGQEFHHALGSRDTSQ